MRLIQQWPNPDGVRKRVKNHWQSWQKQKWKIVKGVSGMGFKELALFNNTILANHCWRMLNDPNALWVQMLKGNYFPQKSLKDATKGASSASSNISEGRDVSKEKLIRQVMDGRT